MKTVTLRVGELVAWASSRWEALTVAGAALCALWLLVLLWRAGRRGKLDDAVTWIAVATATGFSAEGMWEVARESLGLPVATAAAVFVVAEAAMTSEAIRARRRFLRLGHPGPHGRAVWTIAICAGLIVALNSDTLVEVPVRLSLPILAAALWWLGLTSDGVTKPADAITWRYTPRRLLVLAGLADPGENDLAGADRERRVSRMVDARLTLLTAPKARARRRALGKLRDLAADADAFDVAEVRTRVDRVFRIETLTAPAGTVVDEVDPATRAMLDGVIDDARQARRRLSLRMLVGRGHRATVATGGAPAVATGGAPNRDSDSATVATAPATGGAPRGAAGRDSDSDTARDTGAPDDATGGAPKPRRRPAKAPMDNDALRQRARELVAAGKSCTEATATLSQEAGRDVPRRNVERWTADLRQQRQEAS